MAIDFEEENLYKLTKDPAKKLELLKAALDKRYKELSIQQKAWYAIGKKTGNKEYEKLYEDYKNLTQDTKTPIQLDNKATPEDNNFMQITKSFQDLTNHKDVKKLRNVIHTLKGFNWQEAMNFTKAFVNEIGGVKNAGSSISNILSVILKQAKKEGYSLGHDNNDIEIKHLDKFAENTVKSLFAKTALLDKAYQKLTEAQQELDKSGKKTDNLEYDKLYEDYKNFIKENRILVNTHIHNLLYKVNQAYLKLTVQQQELHALGQKTGNLEYDQLIEDDDNLINNKVLIDINNQALLHEKAELIPNILQSLEELVQAFRVVVNKTENLALHNSICTNIIVPILNNTIVDALIPISTETQTQALPNMFEGVSSEFTKALFIPAINTVADVLNGQSNEKVQEIYKNILLKPEGFERNIVKNVIGIIDSGSLNTTIPEHIIPFVQDPHNRTNIAKIVENILAQNSIKVIKPSTVIDSESIFISPELLDNTMNLTLDLTQVILKDAPGVGKAYNHFIQNQPEEFLKNIEPVINKIAPIVRNDLPTYLEKNKLHLMDFLSLSQQKLEEKYGIPTRLVQKALDKTTPFINDALPIITELVTSALQGDENKQVLYTLITQTKDLENATSNDEQTKKITILIDSLINFKNATPTVKDIVEKQLLILLIKHADQLGPVADEFMKDTIIGRKFKLKCDGLIKALSPHLPNLEQIVLAYSNKQYSKVVKPIWNLLSDKKVFATIIHGSFNFIRYQVGQAVKKITGRHQQQIQQERHNLLDRIRG